MLNGRPAPADAIRWTEVCTGSGACIEACEHGINPRLMIKLAKARQRWDEDADGARAAARQDFRTMARGVKVISRLQLLPQSLGRIQHREEAAPEVVFYTGCNLLKTPHIALVCVEVLDRLGIPYQIMGGPSHCCGVYQINAGDLPTASRVGYGTIEKLAQAQTSEVLSWCPSCQTNLGEVTLPAFRISHQTEAFALTPFIQFLHRHLSGLAPHFTRPVEKRVALLERPAFPGIVEGARAILSAIPGLQLIELDVPRVGTMANSLNVLPDFKSELREAEFAAAAAAKVDTFATLFHACHRDICHYDGTVSFEIINFMELIGEAMGISHPDMYKQMKQMNDVDEVVRDMAPNIERYGLDLEQVRESLWADMFAGIR